MGTFLCIQEVILLKGEAAKVVEGQQINQCAPRLKIINEMKSFYCIISTLTCLHHSLQALSFSVFVFC